MAFSLFKLTFLYLNNNGWCIILVKLHTFLYASSMIVAQNHLLVPTPKDILG